MSTKLPNLNLPINEPQPDGVGESTYNEVDVRQYYRMLGHSSSLFKKLFTNIRIWNKAGTIIYNDAVDTELQFVRVCKEYSGKSNSLYACLNPFNRQMFKGNDGDKYDDNNITTIYHVLLDVDVHDDLVTELPEILSNGKHRTKTIQRPATNQSVEQAKVELQKILTYLKEQGFNEPFTAFSGNGFHIILRVNMPKTENTKNQIDALFRDIEANTGVHIDPANKNPSRVSRIIGTLNVRGESSIDRPHRLSAIINEGSPDVDIKLMEKYFSTENKTKTDKNRKKSTYYMKVMRPCIRQIFMNNVPDARGQSGNVGREAMMCLVADCQHYKLGIEDIIEVFRAKLPNFDETTSMKEIPTLLVSNAKEGTSRWLCATLKEKSWCTDITGECRFETKSDEDEAKTNVINSIIDLAVTNALEFYKDQYNHVRCTFNPIIRESIDTPEQKPDVMTFLTMYIDKFPQKEVGGIKEGGEKKDIPTNIGIVSERMSNTSVTSANHVMKESCPVLRLSVDVKSEAFSGWLMLIYNRKYHEVPKIEFINSAVKFIHSTYSVEPIRKLYTRLAPLPDGSILWDLSDGYGRAVHITKNGWDIIIPKSNLFFNFMTQAPIPPPTRGGSLSSLLQFMNLSKPGDRLLALLCFGLALVPDIPHFGMIVHGMYGSGKTTFQRVHQQTIDPTVTDVTSMQKDIRELILYMNNHYVCAFDNTSYITDEQSNTICTAITGGGFEEREYYTNEGIVAKQFSRCITISGINVTVEKPDLFSRCLIFDWTVNDDFKYISEVEIRKRIVENSSNYRGALLDLLVKAMNIYPTVKSNISHRMDDSVRWCSAFTIALGLDQSEFETAFQENLDAQNEESLNVSFVGTLIMRYISDNGSILGKTTSEIKTMLETYDPNLPRNRSWVQSPKSLGHKIKDITPALRKCGYVVEKIHSERGATYTIMSGVTDEKPQGVILSDDRLQNVLSGGSKEVKNN
jgi:hypothetical protein